MGDSIKTALAPIAVDTVRQITTIAVQELSKKLTDGLPEAEQPAAQLEAARLITADLTQTWPDAAPSTFTPPASSLQAAEEAAARIQAPDTERVKLDDLLALVQAVEFSTPAHTPHQIVAMVKLHTGFSLVGSSAPMDPANFNADFGRKLAFDDAIRQMWPMVAFARLLGVQPATPAPGGAWLDNPDPAPTHTYPVADADSSAYNRGFEAGYKSANEQAKHDVENRRASALYAASQVLQSSEASPTETLEHARAYEIYLQGEQITGTA